MENFVEEENVGEYIEVPKIPLYDTFLVSRTKECALRILPDKSEVTKGSFVRASGLNSFMLDNPISLYHRSFSINRVFSESNTIDDISLRYRYLSYAVSQGHTVTFINYGTKSKVETCLSENFDGRCLVFDIFDSLNSYADQIPGVSLKYSAVKFKHDVIMNYDGEEPLIFNIKTFDMDHLPQHDIVEGNEINDIVPYVYESYNYPDNEYSYLFTFYFYYQIDDKQFNGRISILELLDNEHLLNDQIFYDYLKNSMNNIILDKKSIINKLLNILFDSYQVIHFFEVLPLLEYSKDTINTLSIMGNLSVIKEYEIYETQPSGELSDLRKKLNQKLVDNEKLWDIYYRFENDIVDSSTKMLEKQQYSDEMKQSNYFNDEYQYGLICSHGKLKRWETISGSVHRDLTNNTNARDKLIKTYDGLKRKIEKTEKDIKDLERDNRELEAMQSHLPKEIEKLDNDLSTLKSNVKALNDKRNMLIKVVNIFEVDMDNINDNDDDDNMSVMSYYSTTKFDNIDVLPRQSSYQNTQMLNKPKPLANSVRPKSNFPALPAYLPKGLAKERNQILGNMANQDKPRGRGMKGEFKRKGAPISKKEEQRFLDPKINI